MSIKQPRLSFAALEQYLHSIYDITPVNGGGRPGAHQPAHAERVGVDPMRCVAPKAQKRPRLLTDGVISDSTGYSRAMINRWRAEGEIPLYAADRAAIRAGAHPLLIWGDEFHQGCELEDVS